MIETGEPIVIFARSIENLIDLNININKILFKFYFMSNCKCLIDR